MKYSFESAYFEGESLIHKINVKTKIIVLLCLLLAIVLTPLKYSALFCVELLFVVFLIFLSGLPFKFIFLRILKLLPFLGLISLSLLFKEGGFYLFVSALAKSFFAVILTTIIFSTSKFPDILKALEELKIPRIFTESLNLMRRYIFVFEDMISQNKRGFDSRNIGKIGSLRKITIFSNMIGIMIIKVFEKSQKVYMAMLSRGYNGKFSD